MSSNHRESSNCYYVLSPYCLRAKSLAIGSAAFCNADLIQELVPKLNGFDLIGLAFVHQHERQVVNGLNLLAANMLLHRADVAAGHEEQRQARVR